MDIKKKIKENFYGMLFISYFHCIESFLLPKIISDKEAVKKFYKKNTGKELNLSSPQSFSEKLNWYKLNSKDELMQHCADKYSVREYIIKCGYEELLNEIYGVYDHVQDIDISKFPKQFVLKATHGSHMCYIVKDKSTFDVRKAKTMMKSWMHQNIYWSGREWVYKDIPRKILAEKYLADETGELKDYKFYCFNGVPEFMQYESGRFEGKQIRNFYDMNWNLQPFGKGIPYNSEIKVSVPDRFEDMKVIAEKLSKPFQFVRVDLYQVNERIYFGELTFFPAGGTPDFIPSKYDYIVGEKWIIK